MSRQTPGPNAKLPTFCVEGSSKTEIVPGGQKGILELPKMCETIAMVLRIENFGCSNSIPHHPIGNTHHEGPGTYSALGVVPSECLVNIQAPHTDTPKEARVDI